MVSRYLIRSEMNVEAAVHIENGPLSGAEDTYYGFCVISNVDQEHTKVLGLTQKIKECTAELTKQVEKTNSKID